MDESEYESDVAANVDDPGADENAGLKDQERSEQNRHFQETSGNTYLQRNVDDQSVQTNPDAFADYKLIENKNLRNDKPDDMKNSFDEYQTVSSDRLANKYIENNDAKTQEIAQHLTNRDVNNYNSNRYNNVLRDDPVNKKTIKFRSVPKEEGDMLFETSREQLTKLHKNEHSNNEAFDSNQQSRQYYNPEQTEERVTMYHNNGRLDLNRNRRQVQEANQGDTANIANGQDEKEEIKKNSNEDEESAIKRHIKKMSGEELEELLNSLSVEKRELLKKIMDNSDTTENEVDSINKREITKKAGAVGENSYNEGSLSDSSKFQEGNPVDINSGSSTTQHLETTGTNKCTESQTENNNISSSKSVVTNISDSRADISSPTDGTDERKLDGNLNSPDVASNIQMPSKNANKRETNANESADMDSEDVSLDDTIILGSNLKDTQDSLNDRHDFCSQDEDLSQLLDDEAQLHTDRGKSYKREIQEQTDLSDSIKSLEESFPNSEAYSDESGPYTGTLVRVKRKNSDQVIKKRSAALLPDAKVPFFPYRAENDDEDNDEGNEFDDDGFYDPTSNFAKYNNDLEDLSIDDSTHSEQAKKDNADLLVNDIDRSKVSRNGNDRMSLGSDSDSVLSGVEGVDDNLMYSSGLRNRRTSGNNVADEAGMKDQPLHSSSLTNEVKKESDNYIIAPNYQEDDAFGPLPKNYDGDLGRYKRIRRVKQSHTSEEEASSDS